MIYKIYQLKDIRNCPYGFESYGYADGKFNIKDYEIVYEGTVLKQHGLEYDEFALEILYRKFNEDRPEDFKGHSLSVSDVVALEEESGEESMFYCDRFGWKDITDIVKTSNRMTYEEMIDYLLDELKQEKNKWLLGKENNYSYIFMICNDIGLTKEGQ